MLDWWLEHGPPVYVSAAAYLGLTNPKTEKSSGDLNDLAKLAGADGMIG